MKKLPRFEIWTDGSCRVHGDKTGTWAYLIVNGEGEVIHEKSGHRQNTTSPAMELMAVIKGIDYALKSLPHGEIVVYSDSEVVTKGITEWIVSWKMSNWRTSAGKSVKNKALWKHLDFLTDVVDVNFTWVKGHAGTELNERVDKMCRRALDKYDNNRKDV